MSFVSTLARAVTLTTLAGAASLCMAQGAAAPAAPAKKELVQKALQLQQAGLENLGNQLAQQTAQQLLQEASRAMGQVPADKRELVGNEIQAEVRKFYEDVAPQLRAAAVKAAPSTMGTALEEKLSEDELKTLLAWLESPVSRKFQLIVAETQQALTQKMVADTKPSIEPKLKALTASVGKKLGVQAPVGASAAPAKPAASGAKK